MMMDRASRLARKAATWRSHRVNAVTFWRRWYWLQPSWWFYGPHRVSRVGVIYHIRGQWWWRGPVRSDGGTRKKWERVP